MEEDPRFFIKVGEDGERVMLAVQKDDSLSDKGLVKRKIKERDETNPNTIPTQSNFDDAEPVWTQIDFENTLSKGQHLPSPNRIVTMKKRTFLRGNWTPHMHSWGHEPRHHFRNANCNPSPG